MLLDRNQLPEPEAISRVAYQTLLTNFKEDFIANVKAESPTLAEQLTETLEQPGELITKMFETFSQYLLNEIERRNQQALQLLPGWANGSNLDNLVVHQGIERQILTAADDDAFPAVAAVEESDEALFLRYLLQPHSPAAGSRMQYKATLLTLDESPIITVDKPSENQVRLTYTLSSTGYAAQIKDANGLRTSAGEVMATVLAWANNGLADEPLLEAVRDHFKRDDVSPGTDVITVQSADIIEYQQKVIVQVNNGPDPTITEESVQLALQAYADERHLLGAEVRPDYISHLLYQQGAKRAEVLLPLDNITCNDFQAPWCKSIEVEVQRI
ncbi:baseplate J/gp47 family protein [Gammaproteobacteria bacterium AS21]